MFRLAITTWKSSEVACTLLTSRVGERRYVMSVRAVVIAIRLAMIIGDIGFISFLEHVQLANRPLLGQ